MSKTNEFLNRCENFGLKRGTQISFTGIIQNNVEELMAPIDIKPQTIEEFALSYFDTPKQAAYFISATKHNNRLNNEPA